MTLQPLNIAFNQRCKDEIEIRKAVKLIQDNIVDIFDVADKMLECYVNCGKSRTTFVFPRLSVNAKMNKIGSVFIETCRATLATMNTIVLNNLLIIESVDVPELNDSSLCYHSITDDDVRDEEYSHPEVIEWDVDEDETKEKKMTVAEKKKQARSQCIIEAMDEEKKWMGRIVGSVLDLIDIEKRVIDEEQYTIIGSAIFNSGPNLLALFEHYVGNKFGYECKEIWDVWLEDGSPEHEQNLNSLQKWAIEDNKEAAMKLFKDNIDFLVLQSLNHGASYFEIANIMRCLYADKFICSNTSGSAVWWKFNKTKWEEFSNGIADLRKILTFKVRPLFKRANVNNAVKREESKRVAAIAKEKIDNMVDKSTYLTKILSEPSGKNNIMKEAADLFFEDKFVKKLDDESKYFAFNNKVWNCDSLEFENGNPYHYLSQSTDYDINPIEDDKEDIEWWYENFINKVFPPDFHVYDNKYRNYLESDDHFNIGPIVYDKEGNVVYTTKKIVYHETKSTFHHPVGKEVFYRIDNEMQPIGHITDRDCTPVYQYRDYFFTLLSAGMNEGAKIKKYLVVTGSTNNGKSVFNFIINLFAGETFTDTPKALLLCSKKQSEGPTPGWHQLNKAKFTGLVEPVNGARFHDGNLKLLTNGGLDRAEGRDLFMKGSEAKKCHITPKSLAYCFCNSIPSVDGSDEAIKTRIIIFPLETVWDSKCPYKSEEERKIERHYPRDENFKEQCKARVSAFAHIMIGYYVKFASIKNIDSMSEPSTVTTATRSYFNQNNPTMEFVRTKFNLLDEDHPNFKNYEAEKKKRLNKKYKFDINSAFAIYRQWHIEVHGNDKNCINRTDFVYKMVKNGYKDKNGQFCGITKKNSVSAVGAK